MPAYPEMRENLRSGHKNIYERPLIAQLAFTNYFRSFKIPFVQRMAI